MKRMNPLVCSAAIMLMFGTAVSYVHAQYGTGRALLAYPMKGQTLEQENADRWSVMIGRLLRLDTIPRLCIQLRLSSTGSQLGRARRLIPTPSLPNKPADSLQPWETPTYAV